MQSKEIIFKILLVTIISVSLHYSTKNFNKAKKSLEDLEDSKSMNILLEYMHNCEERILYLLFFLIMHSIVMAILY